ncbi:MAG: ATP-binding cassette domain-containing protein, partial [Planctomycetaceae bacterium]|nr:ATP-binding cassette domain-containing protein [Planctomycetaceae bacterium]
DLHSLRQGIGIVFQDSFLFSNTVAANIAFGTPHAQEEQIWRAAEMASADDFIREMPQGLQSMIGEHGANLSGGQRQRLSLARAILTSPGVLLLDDATASVDPETEHEIQEAMLNATENRTTLIVSNRLSTLRRMDRILILNEGQLQAEGSHQELRQTNPWYHMMAEMQFADSFVS